MMFARSNIIVRGYDLFILKGLDETPFHSVLNVSTHKREGYLFFAFDNEDIIVSREFAEDIYKIFMHMPLITRVDTYTVGIVDLYELFKRFIELKDFELIGRIIESVLVYMDKDGVFKDLHYSQGWFIFSVNAKKYYAGLLGLSEKSFSNGIMIKKGVKLLDDKTNIFRKCDEVEQNPSLSFANKVYENGRYKEFEGYKLGVVDRFELKDFELR